MFNPIRLLAPALIPSWNFFDAIADSPRVEFARLSGPDDPGADWREFRPRPAHVPVSQMFRRMLWNARWNEALFVMSCAERLLDRPTAHSEDEIYRRIAADLADAHEDGPPWLGFRIVLVGEDETDAVTRETAYVAEPRPLAGIDVR